MVKETSGGDEGKELLQRPLPKAPAPPVLKACPVAVKKIKTQQLWVPQGEEQPPPQAVARSMLPYTPAKLVDLGTQFQQKPSEPLPTWLLSLWDLGEEGTALSGLEMSKLASLTTHPSLQERLQKMPFTPREPCTLDWLTAAVRAVWPKSG